MRLQLLSLVLLVSCPVFAQEVAPPNVPIVPPGEDRIEYLEQGAVAPYSGYLYDPSTAVRWGNWLYFWKHTYVVDMTEQKKVCDVRQISVQNMHKIDLEAKNKIIAEQQRLIEAHTTPWHESVWFGAGAGAAGTFGLTLFSVWAVGRIK